MVELLRHLPLIGFLLAIETLLALFAWRLARRFGVRLRGRDLAFGITVTLAVLAPFLLSPVLLVPTATLAEQIPGAAQTGPPDPYDRGLNDAVLQFFPWEAEVRRAFAARRLPFWSDALDGGSNLWGNPQAQILSPLALLARLAPLHHFLLAGLAFAQLVAFAGTLALLARLGVRRWAARLGALAFALGGGFAPWAVFPHRNALPWVPWVVLGALHLARRRDRRAVPTVTLLTTALLLGGHPEIAAAGCGLAGLVALTLWSLRIGWRRAGAAWGATLLLGFALAAPQWLPLFHLVAGSERSAEQREAAATAGRSAGALGFEGNGEILLLGLLHPSPVPDGSPEGHPPPGSRPLWSHQMSAYVGLAGLAGLALLLAAPPPRRSWPFLAVGLYTLLALADFAPLARTTRALPLLRLVEDSRFMPVGTLALAVAAALGLGTLRRRRGQGRRAVALGGAAAASLLAGAPGGALALWTGIALAAGLARRRVRAAALLLVAITLADLVGWEWRLLPRGERAHFYPETAFMARVAAEREPARGARVTGHDLLVYPSTLTLYGLDEARPYNPLAPARQLATLRAAFDYRRQVDHYFSPLRRLEHPFLDFLAVSTVVSNSYLPQPEGFERIDSGEALPQPFVLLHNPGALPRWFLATGADGVPEEELAAWIERMTEPRRVAVAPALAATLEAPLAAGEVRRTGGRPGRIELALAAPAPGPALLATSIPGPDGWRVRADGVRLEPLAINGAYLGAHLPAGTRRVELRFRPPGLLAGCGLALGALLLLAAGRWRREGTHAR